MDHEEGWYDGSGRIIIKGTVNVISCVTRYLKSGVSDLQWYHLNFYLIIDNREICVLLAVNLKNLKKSHKIKYDARLRCRWALITAWAFEFKLHLIFHRVEFKIRFNILFCGFSWYELEHSGFLWEQDLTSLILH